MCRTPLEAKSSKRTFCGPACRQRAYRRRKAGLPESFLSEGAGATGRRSLAEQRGRIRQLLDLVSMGAVLTERDFRAILGRR
jgi:hypothetical protein